MCGSHIAFNRNCHISSILLIMFETHQSVNNIELAEIVVAVISSTSETMATFCTSWVNLASNTAVLRLVMQHYW